MTRMMRRATTDDWKVNSVWNHKKLHDWKNLPGSVFVTGAGELSFAPDRRTVREKREIGHASPFYSAKTKLRRNWNEISCEVIRDLLPLYAEMCAAMKAKNWCGAFGRSCRAVCCWRKWKAERFAGQTLWMKRCRQILLNGSKRKWHAKHCAGRWLLFAVPCLFYRLCFSGLIRFNIRKVCWMCMWLWIP